MPSDAISEIVEIQQTWGLTNQRLASIAGIQPQRWIRWKNRQSDPLYKDLMRARARVVRYARERTTKAGELLRQLEAHGA